MMSTLVENVQKVVDAHAGLSAAIASKGVDVPVDVKLSQMPQLVDSIEVREPLYVPHAFSFNGWLSGENLFNMHVDATKPITIDPTEVRSYERMFQKCYARSIVVPELTVLATLPYVSTERMFCDAFLLSSFTVPKGFWRYITVCDYMLSGCSNLSSIDMSEEDGGALSGVTSMNGMFNGCTSLTSIQFPEGSGTQLTGNLIASGFVNCTNLQKLVFPAGFGGTIGYLRSQNITGCDSLRTIEFGAGAFPKLTAFQWIGDGNNTPSLSSIVFGSEDFGLSVQALTCQTQYSLKSLELPDNFGLSSRTGYLNVGNYAVVNCRELTSLKYPANVRCYNNSGTIYPSKCPKLTHITLPTASGKSYESYTAGNGRYKLWPDCPNVQHVEGNLMIDSNGTIDISHLTQLDHSSLLVIINGLYDHVGAGSPGTRYIKLGDVNSAQLSDEEKAIATNKGWTIV